MDKVHAKKFEAKESTGFCDFGNRGLPRVSRIGGIELGFRRGRHNTYG